MSQSAPLPACSVFCCCPLPDSGRKMSPLHFLQPQHQLHFIHVHHTFPNFACPRRSSGVFLGLPKPSPIVASVFCGTHSQNRKPADESTPSPKSTHSAYPQQTPQKKNLPQNIKQGQDKNPSPTPCKLVPPTTQLFAHVPCFLSPTLFRPHRTKPHKNQDQIQTSKK